MKRVLSEMRWGWVSGVLLWAACAAMAAPPETQVATVTTPAMTKAAAERLRATGIESALSGQYAKGLEQLREAAKVSPEDTIAREAARLLEEHLQRWNRAVSERAGEYRRTVERIRHCMVVQEYVEKAPEADRKKHQEAVKKVLTAYNQMGTAEALEDATTAKEAGEVKSQSLQALDKSAEALAAATQDFATASAVYGQQFRDTSASAARLIKEYRGAWQAIAADDANKWPGAGKHLRELEYDLTDDLADLEVVTSGKPWRIALAHARVASRLVTDRDELTKADWFTDLVKDITGRGREFVADANWYDALSAYAGLQDLLPDDPDIEKTVKVVQRHVRVLGLYGRPPVTTQPAKANEEPPWRELVANVDADMVEKVIGQLDLSYVSAVDYRKVTRGALTSIKVLAETPQAAYSLPGLKDDQKRKRFLDVIARQMEDVDKRDRVTHLDLILALNGILRASEQTVKIPTEVLAVEFTDGFLDELDKFSSMIWPHDVPDFEKQTMGHFFGVGIQIAKEPGQPLRVVTPLIGTPAFRAGIKAGDLIVKVDGVETENLSIDKLVQSIMGPKGTKVVLTVKHSGRVKDYDIVRDQIHIRTVKGWERLPKTGEWEYLLDREGTIGYLRVTQFTAKTTDSLADALRKMRAKGVRSVVLDLRFNPGGLLRAAARVANEFLISGRIVSTRGRRTEHTELNANPSGSYLDGDLVVLVNQYSASAAEIVSGALKDWKRARIVGQRSYGKGSVQNVISIQRHNSLLKLTTAYYYLPHGRLLHRQNGSKDWGVDPDVEVFLTPRQTKRWLDIRRKTDIVQDVAPELLREDLDRQYDADIQLNTAVLLLKLLRLQQRSQAA